MQQEIKAGFKQTDVGTIPQDWDMARIVDVASITTGSRNTQDRIETGIYPFFVRSQTVERINSYSFDGEAVLTAGDGVGTGKIFHYINGKFDLHQRVYQISNFSPRLNGFFFYLYFASKFFDRIMSMTAKSSVDSVRREMIADMLMPLPPPDEQRAIAAALADADGLIAALEGMIAKKRDLKQAAMQHLLTGKTRLPGFSGEWEVKRLGDHIHFQVGYPFASSSFNKSGSGTRLIRNRDLKSDDDVVYYSGDFDSSYLVQLGDLLVSMDGEFILSEWKGSHALLNQRVGRINSRAGIKTSFLKHYLAKPLKEIENATASTTVKHLSHGDIERIEIALPAPAEQTAIAEVLSDMDADLAALEAQAAKARAVKQGMMQELLTGRVRLV